LTWSLRREGLRVLFGPVTFYDGQGFLVPERLHVDHAADLAGVPVCVAEGSEHDVTLTAYFLRHQIALDKVRVVDGPAGGRALADGRCQAFSADVSELASVRSEMEHPRSFRILADRISQEPLAQLVRQEDVDLFNVLRWTVFAMIAAEELGVTSANISEMAARDDPEIARLLGVSPGNGAALGLDEAWARHVIAGVGNYGEVFERNLGTATPIALERGLNALWTRGGLLFAPPLR
jgi:general L-amino acid transport system substrate-binding protein